MIVLHTEILKADDVSLRKAALLLSQGKVVAFATETVYGLGGHALNEEAVYEIFAAKQRPADNPLIVHIDQKEQAFLLCHWNKTAESLANAFWPGPLTLLLPKKSIVPDIVTAGLPTVAIRLPSHPAAQALLRACGFPLAAPSANRSGRPSPTTAEHVYEDLNGRIPLILDGGSCEVGLDSTVLDLSSETPTILRPGAVTAEQIAMVTGSCDVAPSVMRPLLAGEHAPSPGMRHRHYAPNGRLTLVYGDAPAAANEISRLYDTAGNARILAMHANLPLYGDRLVSDLGSDAATAAHRLFYLLRAFDEQDVDQIFCETLPASGLGLAVMNRLARAAEFNIINV